MTKIEIVNKIFTNQLKTLKEDDFPVSIEKISPTVMSFKSNRSLGRCVHHRRNGTIRHQIKLNESLINVVDVEKNIPAIKSVLTHEIIHTFTGCDNHGRNFKHYAMLVSNKYEDIDVWTHATKLEYSVFNESIKDNIKYYAECLCCGQKLKAFKKTLFVKEILGETNNGESNYFCSHCQNNKSSYDEKGNFVTTFVITRKDGKDLPTEEYILPKNLKKEAHEAYQKKITPKTLFADDGYNILLFDESELPEKVIACTSPDDNKIRKVKREKLPDISISLF